MLLMLLGCDKKQETSSERTEPWPAPAAASASAARAAAVRSEYALAPGQRVEFQLKTKSTSIEGLFPLLRGSLSVDLMQLSESEAQLQIDVGAARITSGKDDDENVHYSLTAHNWLNVGASLPEATRERRRWASFLVEELTETGALAAHEARVSRKLTERAQAPEQDAGTDAEVESDAEAPEARPGAPAEVRATRAKLVGSLELNQRKVTAPYQVELQFHYPTEASPGFPPDRIVVQSVGSVQVLLAQHDIEPRNSAGERIAADMKLLGKQVGRVARLRFALEFLPKPEAEKKRSNSGN